MEPGDLYEFNKNNCYGVPSLCVAEISNSEWDVKTYRITDSTIIVFLQKTTVEKAFPNYLIWDSDSSHFQGNVFLFQNKKIYISNLSLKTYFRPKVIK